MLVGTHDGSVDVMDAPVEFTSRIGTLLDRRQEPFPDSGASPPLKAAVDRGPRPIPLGQVPPRRPRAQDPQDPIEDTPMVGGGPSRVRLFGEQRLQPLPLFIGQFMSPSHALTLSSLSSLHTRPSPTPLEGDVRAAAEREVGVSTFRLESTVTRSKSQGRVIGGQGRAGYHLFSPDPARRAVFAILADYARFSGVGVNTTRGMGQCRRVQPPGSA